MITAPRQPNSSTAYSITAHVQGNKKIMLPDMIFYLAGTPEH
jgi:hypothetical protein